MPVYAPGEEIFPELAFPCEYPVKVMGLNQADFHDMVVEIISRHVPGLPYESFSSRKSSGEKYVSVSVSFLADSRGQIDALYKELAENKLVLTAF
jgi:putative lipoic acid-binding regulatory protein